MSKQFRIRFEARVGRTNQRARQEKRQELLTEGRLGRPLQSAVLTSVLFGT